MAGLGTVSDFLFDDASWSVRWLVVDTGTLALRSQDRAVQRSIHDAHGEDCTDAAEGDAMPTI